MCNKKIIFLVMSCQQEFFKNEFSIIKDTWAKDIISGYYGENVMFLGYDGWDKETYLDEKNNMLHLKCEDDANHTYKKTYCALKYLQEKYNFDFVFRTNTSTYINVPYIINFVNTLDSNTEIIWGGDIYSLPQASTPFPQYLFCRGNAILMSRKTIEIFLTYGITHLYNEKLIDDEGIGNVLNSYHISRGENYKDFIKCFQFGWYKSVDTDICINNHPLSEFWNNDTNFEKLCLFLAIQVKKYQGNRHDEFQSLIELDRIFREHNYIEVYRDSQPCIDTIMNYSLNYPVFLGSFIGYINLCFFDLFDREKLYLYQIAKIPDIQGNKDLLKRLKEQYKYLV